MGQKLDTFAAECHRIIGQGATPENLDQVRLLLEPLLTDEEFLAEHMPPEFDANRETLYQDTELGFCILAHVFKGANEAPPHDHGPTWAIYGQSQGITHMTEFRKLTDANDDAPGKVEPTKVYDLEPGMAVAYPAGALHAPKREADTRLIRIEGAEVSKFKRDKYAA